MPKFNVTIEVPVPHFAHLTVTARTKAAAAQKAAQIFWDEGLDLQGDLTLIEREDTKVRVERCPRP